MAGQTLRSPQEAEQIRAQWIAQAQAVRERMAMPGRTDPAELAAGTGLAFLERIMRGELPGIPMGEHMGLVPVEAEPGRIVFQGIPDSRFYNPIGSVHGGYLATLLDSAVGCAVHTTLAQGMGYTTLELKVNYLRGLTDQVGPVRGEGRVVSVSRQIGVAEGSVVDAAGRLYAHATTTCLIFPLPAGRTG